MMQYKFHGTLFVLIIVVNMICVAQGNQPPPAISGGDLLGLTTPIEVKFANGQITRGSGFFYNRLAPPGSKTADAEPQWRKVDRLFVVTAKHVIQPKRLNQIEYFSFDIRVRSGDHAEFHPIRLTAKQLGERLHLCKNDEVDVAVVDVYDLFSAETKLLIEEKIGLLGYSGANQYDVPGVSPIDVRPGDDVVVIGYPLGFYDTFNKLPVLKTGLLNTPVGTKYNGEDAFLLDFKYYEGSSGSLIISKPTYFSFNKDKQLQTSQAPQFVFLGVYEGEEYWNSDIPERPDLGLGWYYYTIEEAIGNPPVVHRP
jgi:Trypsin-like peptidase domain